MAPPRKNRLEDVTRQREAVLDAERGGAVQVEGVAKTPRRIRPLIGTASAIP